MVACLDAQPRAAPEGIPATSSRDLRFLKPNQIAQWIRTAMTDTGPLSRL